MPNIPCRQAGKPHHCSELRSSTPAAIRKAGADIVCYGAPVLPGAMFLLGYIGATPISF